MFSLLLLWLNAIVVLCSVCQGTFISSIAYTLTDVESVNGSSANGGCPQQCEGMASGVRRCDCRNSSANITGVLIDGMVPIIDTSMRGTWAAELYTVETTMTTLPIGFFFQSSVMLHEVELYVFYCPAWDIEATTISAYNGVSFPNFVRIGVSAESVGSVTLTSDIQNCEDLTRVSIPLQMATSSSIYFIEFTDPTPPQQLYIAEVRFSDQPIPPSTEPATTPEPSTSPFETTAENQVTLITTSPTATVTDNTINEMNMSTPSSQTAVTLSTLTSDMLLPTGNQGTTTLNTASLTIITDSKPSLSPMPSPPPPESGPPSSSVTGALIGVIMFLLVVLSLGGVATIMCFVRIKMTRTYMDVTGKKHQDMTIHQFGKGKDIREQSCDSCSSDFAAKSVAESDYEEMNPTKAPSLSERRDPKAPSLTGSVEEEEEYQYSSIKEIIKRTLPFSITDAAVMHEGGAAIDIYSSITDLDDGIYSVPDTREGVYKRKNSVCDNEPHGDVTGGGDKKDSSNRDSGSSGHHDDDDDDDDDDDSNTADARGTALEEEEGIYY